MMSIGRRVGFADMTEMSEIDEIGINQNLNVRYNSDIIYVSLTSQIFYLCLLINFYGIMKFLKLVFRPNPQLLISLISPPSFIKSQEITWMFHCFI